MYKKMVIGVAVPAYNESRLIKKTLNTIPDFVDHIVVINDCSTDNTLEIIMSVAKHDKRITLINNEKNGGLGYSLRNALLKASELGCDKVAIMAGDAQMDPSYLAPMLDDMLARNLDFIKANRFMHFDALAKMPLYRRVGNIIVTILTKFATGYYSIFDTQNGYVVYTKDVIDRMPWRIVGDRYEYENTVLIGLSIIDARVGDYPIPAMYGEETSTINLFSTTTKVLWVLLIGFWRRIYYKYILYGFHPIALFLVAGTFLSTIGVISILWILVEKIFSHVTPTSGTVMLGVLPVLVGLQLMLTSLVMDVIEEKKA